MLLEPELYADKHCVSVLDLLLVRNLYDFGYPEPDPRVSKLYTLTTACRQQTCQLPQAQANWRRVGLPVRSAE